MLLEKQSLFFASTSIYMAILWTGLGNWSIWKINWQKKCSWFNVRMFVLAQGTGRWWDFLSAAMQIYASLKCLPNYSLGLTLREWLSQNLPVKIWTWFKKSLLAVHFFFFFLNLSFLCSSTFSVRLNSCHQKCILLSSKDLPCDSLIQKLCRSTHRVILSNMHREKSIFSRWKLIFFFLLISAHPPRYSWFLCCKAELDWHPLRWTLCCSLLLFAAGCCW